jgi:hypothetical protein
MKPISTESKKALLGVLGVALILIIGGAIFYGLPALSATVFRLANPIAEITFVVDLLILPLALLKKLRLWVGFALWASSVIFGIVLWTFSAILCFVFYGYSGLFFGLIWLGIGVFPVAFLAAALHSEWVLVAALVVEAILTVGAKTIGSAMIESTRTGFG